MPYYCQSIHICLNRSDPEVRGFSVSLELWLVDRSHCQAQVGATWHSDQSVTRGHLTLRASLLSCWFNRFRDIVIILRSAIYLLIIWPYSYHYVEVSFAVMPVCIRSCFTDFWKTWLKDWKSNICIALREIGAIWMFLLQKVWKSYKAFPSTIFIIIFKPGTHCPIFFIWLSKSASGISRQCQRMLANSCLRLSVSGSVSQCKKITPCAPSLCVDSLMIMVKWDQKSLNPSLILHE